MYFFQNCTNSFIRKQNNKFCKKTDASLKYYGIQNINLFSFSYTLTFSNKGFKVIDIQYVIYKIYYKYNICMIIICDNEIYNTTYLHYKIQILYTKSCMHWAWDSQFFVPSHHKNTRMGHVKTNQNWENWCMQIDH